MNVATVVVLLLAVFSVNATHYRYGTLNWKTSGEGRHTTFTVDQAWRASFFGSVSMVGHTVDIGQQMFPIAGTGTNYDVILLVTVYNGGEDWFLGTAEFDYTYSADGIYTSEVSQSCCRLSSLVNNADGSYRSTAVVNVVNNVARQGPVSTIPPIVTVTRNQLNTFMLPTINPNDPIIRYRLGTSNEAAGSATFNHIPGLTINPTTGVVSWTPETLGMYSTHFIIEGFMVSMDADAGTNVQSSTSVDFLINVIEEEENTPYFTQITQGGNNVAFDPMSIQNVVIVLQGEENLDLTVYGADDDTGDTVTLTPTTLPTGATGTSTPGNPGSYNVMWTPPSENIMNQVICFTIYDSNGNTAPGQLCVEIQFGGGAVGDPHITSFWGCHIDAPKSEERAVLMTCPSGESLAVSYYAEFDYRIRTVWIVKNGKKEHYKWKSLKHSQKKMVCGNEIEFHRYHAGINIAVKTISNRNIGGMFNDTSCYADKSKAILARSSNSY